VWLINDFILETKDPRALPVPKFRISGVMHPIQLYTNLCWCCTEQKFPFSFTDTKTRLKFKLKPTAWALHCSIISLFSLLYKFSVYFILKASIWVVNNKSEFLSVAMLLLHIQQKWLYKTCIIFADLLVKWQYTRGFSGVFEGRDSSIGILIR
jgi:hypothetical protein